MGAKENPNIPGQKVTGDFWLKMFNKTANQVAVQPRGGKAKTNEERRRVVPIHRIQSFFFMVGRALLSNQSRVNNLLGSAQFALAKATRGRRESPVKNNGLIQPPEIPGP